MGPNSKEMAKIGFFLKKMAKMAQIIYLKNSLLYKLGL
jgi:hypothetical protein